MILQPERCTYLNTSNVMVSHFLEHFASLPNLNLNTSNVMVSLKTLESELQVLGI